MFKDIGNGGDPSQQKHQIGKKLGEGTFGKVRLGVNIFTGEKVTPTRNPHSKRISRCQFRLLSRL